ncbi:MAG TPA: hypothetical protein DEW46_07940, partial [Verrucomicrobia bacterium]|nr:hypothetical protein [Verrucomicrobiota bacterium]
QYTIHANIIDNGFPGQTPLIEWTINEPATNASFTDASIAEPLLKLKDFGSWNLHLSADDGWHTATAEMNVACQPRAAFTPQVHFLHSQLNLAKPRLHPTKPLIFFLNSLGFLQQYNYETGEIAPLLDQGPAASSFDIDPNGRFLLLVQTIEFDGNLKLKKLYLDDLTLEDIPYPHHLPKNLSSSLPRIGIGLNGKAYLSPHLFEFDCANHNLRLRYDLAGSIPDWNDRYLHGEIRASTDRSRLFFLGAAVIDAAADQVIGYDGPRNYTPTYYSLSADGSRVATLHSANNSRVFCLNTPDFKQPIILRDEYDYTPVFHPQAPILFTYRYESDRPWLVAFDTEQLRPAFKLMLPASLQPPDSGRVPKILIHPDGERAFINNRGTLLDIVLPALNEISSVEAVQDYSSVNLAEANPILPNCLANDRFDGFGEPPELKAELLLGPIGAAHFQLHSDGSYEYQPAPGFVGLDRFLYRCSADGSVDDAIAYVEVTSPDHPEFLFPVESVGTDLIVDMVLDDQRNILYYTMNDEEIRRIDLTNRRLLPPLGPVSAGCRLDISPDGRFLYGVSSLKPIYGRAHCLVNTETGFVQPVPAQAFMADSERAFFLNNSTVRLATGGHLFHIDGMYWTTELGAQERTIQWAGRARDHSCIIGFDPNAAWGYRQDSATLVIEGFPISEPMAGQTIYVNADGTQWATRYTLFSPAVSPISTQPAPCDWAFHATPDRPAIARGEYSLDMSIIHSETGALINQVSSQYVSPFSSTPMIVTEPLPPLVTADGHWSIHAVNQGILLVPIPESTQIRMPRPVPDLYFLAPGETLDIDAAHGLLANDWYLPEPGQVTVVLDESYPVNGLQVAQDGSLKFAPSSSFDNVAEFSYRIEGPAGVTQPCLVRITPRDPADDGLFVLPVANCTGAILNTPRNLLHWVDEQGGIYSMELESGRITLERDTNLPLASIEISPDGNTCYCISGELAPGRGTLLLLNLDTGLLRRLPLSGEPVELELLVGQRLAVMADGTCFAGLRTLDLQTGRLSEPVFPLAPAWHQKGEVLRSNDHKLFTVHNNENSCSWTDGTISLHHKVVYAGDPDLGILLAWNGELLDLEGGAIDLPPNLTPSSVSIARLHAASESLIVCSEDGISLYPLGSHTAAFSNGFGVRRDELRMMDTGGQSPHAVLLLDDGRPLKLFSAPAPPVNPMLFPKDDSFHVAPDIDLTLDSQALLINDLFPIEPQPHIILTATPVHGTIIGAEMGSPLPNPIVYRPEPAFTGTDSFHYRLTTGTMPSDEEAVVHLRIDSEPICSEQLPIHNPTDLAFDPVREILYVATPAGVVRYSVKQNRFLPTLAPKEAFSTLDVNPDLNQLFALRNGLPHMRVWDLNQPDESQTVKVPGAHSLLDVAVVDSDWGLFSTLSPDTANHACFQFPTDLPEAFSDQGIEPGFEAKILVDPSSNSAAAIHNNGIRLWESPTSSRAFALSVGTSIGQHGRSAFDQTKGLIVYEGGAFRYDGAFLGRIADLSAATDEIDLSGGVLLHPSMNLLVALSSEYDRLLLLDTATWALLQSTDLGFDVRPYQFVGRQGSEMALNPARNQVYITQPEGIAIVPLFGDSQITVAFDRVNDPGAVLTPASPILSVTPNTAIQIEAEPSAGYGFGHWSVTPDSAGLVDDPDAEQTVVTMLRSGTVQAHFIDGTQACIPTFHVNHPEWGSAGPAQPWINPPIHGTTIDITAQPIEGMAFLGWVTTDGGILEDPTSAVTQLTLVGEPVVTAFFGPAIPYCPYPTSNISGTGLQPIDFNEDGYQEGVGFGSGAPNLIFFDSDQACGFVPSQRTISFPPDLRISSIRAHDFNQDGHGDILVWFSNESFAFWLNPGLGGYPDSAESFQMQQTPVAPHFETFLVGDFNGDGADDLYIYPTGTVHLLQGNSFAEGTPVSPKLGNPTTADFNADGHLDLIGLDGEELAVFLNDGNLNFERIELSVGEISSENSIQVGSINGDPYPDLFLGRWKTIQLFLGLGNGTFSPLPTALPYPIRGFGLIDMEDNGSSDILIWEEHNGTLRLLLNDGSGNFNKPGIVFGPNLSDQPRPVPVDFNRDGDLDLFMNQGIWLFDSVRTFEVIPGIMVNTDPPGTVVGTLTATISDQAGPYTFELLPDYSNDTEHFDLIGDQLILKTSFETDIPIWISLAFRISNPGGMVGSGYFGTTLEIDPASSLMLDRPIARYFYGVGNKDHLPVGIHGLEIASSALELPITYRYAQGIGDRDNGRFELIPARYERAQMLFAPPAFPPRWSSFRIAAEVLETQPPMRGEAIIQFLEATHFGGPYTFDVYHLLNLAAITRLELNQPPTHGTAEIQGPTILYTPPSDKTPREDGFYYTVEDDDGNTHLVQAVIGFDFDFDMDGLLDRYEGEQFGSSYTAWDTDLDGIDDGMEYLTGSDPLDPTKWFRIEAMESAGASVELTFTGSPDRRYSVQQLIDGTWSTIPGFDRIPGTAPEPTTATIPTPPATEAFFRLIVHNP